MREHRLSNSRHRGVAQARIIKGTGRPKQTALPPLKEGQIRCKCGKGVRLRKDGTLMSHKTLVNRVSCIHSYTEPKEQ